MKLYTKIINEETKECLIINQEIAKQQGLESMNVDFAYNGKCYLLGYAPRQPLEELQAEKIAELKAKCSDYIYSIYPTYKQNNASNFTIKNPIGNDLSEDKTNIEVLNEMTDFIDMQRAKNKEYKKQILECQLQEDLDKIIIKYGE